MIQINEVVSAKTGEIHLNATIKTYIQRDGNRVEVAGTFQRNLPNVETALTELGAELVNHAFQDGLVNWLEKEGSRALRGGRGGSRQPLSGEAFAQHMATVPFLYEQTEAANRLNDLKVALDGVTDEELAKLGLVRA